MKTTIQIGTVIFDIETGTMNMEEKEKWLIPFLEDYMWNSNIPLEHEMQRTASEYIRKKRDSSLKKLLT